ncbi:MAG TPA: NAD(P)-dependent oxidoreductase [Solirubrobacteraceae bacterium]|jgi:nucleoside-diphosphate-sugar epimerase|nr:NAD(P)-dependent oxidoreductase [Solirubrobacteraceae bacterium]
MGTILVTGARGVIGSALVSRLGEHRLRLADLPESDLRDPRVARQAALGCDRVVHLAWNTKDENHLNDGLCLDNAQMIFNMLSASLDAGVPRFVFASSVHAHAFAPPVSALAEFPPALAGMDAERAPLPDSPYGASKLFGEAMCRWAATRGLETVSIRFGGVNARDVPPENDPVERSVWLSQRDCAAVVEAALEARLERGFTTLTAVSNNAGRVHALDNELGWVPRDGAHEEPESADAR